MLNALSEKSLSRIIAFGTSFITIFIVSGSVTDPVNLTKLLALGITASVAVGVLAACGIKSVFLRNKLLWTVLGIFLLSAFFSVILSESPFSQGIFGSYGRNNGFLAYLFLSALLLTTASLRRIASHKLIIQGLFFAGYVNLVYCLWVVLFGDFVGWFNPYRGILGTLGNPNFIGAFLGILLAAFVAYALGTNTSKRFKYSMAFLAPLTIFLIFESNAIQGRVVGLSGTTIAIFLYLRSKFGSIVQGLYVLAVAVAGIFALLGALQIGPLTSYIYKVSVSLRGQYWLAGWNTGEAHPFTGVGMDALGDWYRRARDVRAIELPGVNTVVNTAHNVFMDMFAFGGWPLLLSYTFITLLGAKSLLNLILRTKQYDPILAVFATAWAGYQLQSIISINQIGLAVWGWVLTGALVSYEKIMCKSGDEEVSTNETAKTRRVNDADQQTKIVLSSSVFGIVGLLIALPPFTADVKWRSAQTLRAIQAIEESMKPSFFNPPNLVKYLNNIQLFEENNLTNLAHKYALESVEWNAESYDLWRALYFVRNSTPEEKALALKNMKRLDPLNPDVTDPR
jgi:hypothetical protein